MWGLWRTGYRRKVLQLAVSCGVRLHVLQPRGVDGFLVFSVCVSAPISVSVSVGLLLDDVRGVFGVQRMPRSAIQRPRACVVRQDSRALWRGSSARHFVRWMSTVASTTIQMLWGSAVVRASVALTGRPEDGGPCVVLHVDSASALHDPQGGTADKGGAVFFVRCVREEHEVCVVGDGQACDFGGAIDVHGVVVGGFGGGSCGLEYRGCIYPYPVADNGLGAVGGGGGPCQGGAV